MLVCVGATSNATTLQVMLTWKNDLDVGTGDQVIMLGYATYAGMTALKLRKKPAVLERKGVNPFTNQACVFKAKPAWRVEEARLVRA